MMRSADMTEFVNSQTCEEKRRLFLAYQAAAATYSQMVRHLADAAGVVIQSEFEAMNTKVQAARKLSIQAREQLDTHTSEHNCEVPTP
jgi:hypothetical protein